MEKLTNSQKEFVLHNFFTNSTFHGWKNIAEKLIDTGKCVVAGKECIWRGGIGNFIKVENFEQGVDCLMYTFDLTGFLVSEYYRLTARQLLKGITEEKDYIVQYHKEISRIVF